MYNRLQMTYVFSIVLIFNRLQFIDAHSGILNGTTCDVKNYPYYILLSIVIGHGDGVFTFSQCGGSLIQESEVLTGAHCCPPNSSFTAHSNLSGERAKQARMGRRFKIHPKYKSSDPSKYDLCVVKLTEDFDLTEGTQLVELATSVSFKPVLEGGKPVDLMGFGIIWSSSQRPPQLSNKTLHCTKNTALGTDGCLKHFRSIGKQKPFVPSSMFCALPKDTQDIICHGDTGGPVMYNGMQVGVVPLVTSNTCDDREATVFTRVDSELDFITKGFQSDGGRMLVSPMLYTVTFIMNIF